MTDILQQLKNRTQRPTVPEREDPLLSEPILPSIPDSALTQGKSITKVSSKQTAKASASLEDQPVYGSDLRRFTMRIDAPIGIAIDGVCSSQKITPETLLESFFSIYGCDESAMTAVLEEAKLRYQKRKLTGVKRRIKSMNERFSEM